MPWQWPVGAGCAFVLALITTPAGMSGAVLLVPIQFSILHVPSPAVTPTNLLFNVAAVPGGLLRFWLERRLLNPSRGCWSHLQRHLPERSIRRLLGLIGCLVAARYIQTGIQQPQPDTHHSSSR